MFVCVAVLSGIGAYYFFRHLETGAAGEADTLKEFDVIRAKFGSREGRSHVLVWVD